MNNKVDSVPDYFRCLHATLLMIWGWEEFQKKKVAIFSSKWLGRIELLYDSSMCLTMLCEKALNMSCATACEPIDYLPSLLAAFPCSLFHFLLVVEWICDAPIGNGGCRGGGAFEHPVLVLVPWNILLYPLPSLNVFQASFLYCPAPHILPEAKECPTLLFSLLHQLLMLLFLLRSMETLFEGCSGDAWRDRAEQGIIFTGLGKSCSCKGQHGWKARNIPSMWTFSHTVNLPSTGPGGKTRRRKFQIASSCKLADRSQRSQRTITTA